MVLYDLDVSGNCHKVRLFLSLIGQECTLESVAFMDGEHKGVEFTARNAFAELPVLVDGDLVLRDSQAILIHLARKYERADWYPLGGVGEARVAQWLMVAEGEIARGPNDARLHERFGYDLDVDLARKKAHRILAILDDHLSSRDWLEVDRPTIGDVACFPYVALCAEGGVPLERYPAVLAWIGRIKSLPGFIGMPGIEEEAA